MGIDDRSPEATSPDDVPQEDTMTIPTTPGPETMPLPTEPLTTTAPATPVLPAKPARRPVRVGTIVWGLVIAAIGALILAYALDVDLDFELASIIVIGAAGVLLLGGTLANGLRRKG